MGGIAKKIGKGLSQLDPTRKNSIVGKATGGIGNKVVKAVGLPPLKETVQLIPGVGGVVAKGMDIFGAVTASGGVRSATPAATRTLPAQPKTSSTGWLGTLFGGAASATPAAAGAAPVAAGSGFTSFAKSAALPVVLIVALGVGALLILKKR